MLKKLCNMMLSIFMVCASLHLGVLQVNAQEGTNLALNQRVIASSTASGKVIGNVVDGKAVTKATWQNNYGGSEYNRGSGDLVEDLTIDLGLHANINSIVLTWTQSVWAKEFSIEGSFDGKTFFTIKEVNDTNITKDMQKQTINFDEVETQFVKFTFKVPNNKTYGYEIYEIEVFGTPKDNVALNKNVTASTTYPTDTFVVTNINDGNSLSRWGNAYKRDEYVAGNVEEQLTLDLGDEYLVDEVSVSWEAAYASTYTIKGSLDGVEYFVIKEVTGQGGVERFIMNEVLLRYLQLDLYTPATKYGYSIYELSVYGNIYEEESKTELIQLIEEAQNINIYEVSTVSAERFQEALNHAQEVANNISASQHMILEAKDLLNEAINALCYNIALNKEVSGDGDNLAGVTDGSADLSSSLFCSYYPLSVVIDLEKDYLISEVWMILGVSEEDIYHYELQTSLDGIHYTTAFTKTSDEPVSMTGITHSFEEVRARYVKMNISDVNTDFAMIQEINVFGLEATPITSEELQALIAEINAMDLTAYTKASIADLNAAMEIAQVATTSGEISYAYFELVKAKAALVLKEDLNALLQSIKNVAPTISEDGTHIVLPSLNKDGYEVQLYGSSNEAVIGLDGTIYPPLEDMEVKLSYQVVNVSDDEVAFDNYNEVTMTIPGQYEVSAQDNARPDVLPAIREWKGLEGTFTLNNDSRIVLASEALQEKAEMIAFYFEEMLHRQVEVVVGTPQNGDIYLTFNDHKELGKEGYRIDIQDYVKVEAYDETGILYAGMTLTQILSLNKEEPSLPKGIIRDYPAYEIRAMMIDVGRFYMPLNYLEEVSKYMAYYKINEVHVHMNDTGGEQSAAYRIESKKYPEINSSLAEDEIYRQDAYRAFQKEVKKYGIDVITELDSPAHAGFIGLYDPSLIFSGRYMDLSNPRSITFVKELVDELLDGEDPVIQSKSFHIGVDEYPLEHQDAARAYADEMIQYVNAKGYKTRIWAALGGSSGLGGDVPVSKDCISNYWSPSYANSKLMIDEGYEAINTNRGFLYVVPGSNEARNIFSIKEAYEGWDVEDLPGVTVSTSTPLLKGASAAIWYDNNRGISEFDYFQYIKDQFIVIAEKTWVGANVGTTEEFEARIDLFDDKAPGANPLRKEASKTEVVVDYDFEEVDDANLKDNSGNDYDATVHNLTVENGALQLDGAGYLSLPFDSMGFPYTLSFDFYLEAEPQANAILLGGEAANGTLYLNYEGTNKMAYVRNDYIYTFDYDVRVGTWQNFIFTCDDKDMILYVDGILYSKAKPQYKNAITSTFVLPLEKVGVGVVGQLDNFTIQNKVMTYEEILGKEEPNLTNLALNKPVEVSGLEVYDGRMTGEMAVDGDITTRVSFEKKDQVWMIVDLEDTYWIDEIEFQFGELPNQYEVYISEDGNEWTKVYENLNAKGGTAELKEIVFARQVKARYVKYQQLQMFYHSSNDKYYSGNFYELRVFGSSENKLEDLLTQAKEIIMNTEENDTNKAYLQQLARSVDLIENILETSEEITIALNGLEKELAKEPYNTSTYKDELKVQLENKLSDAEDYSYYYKKAISVYLDSNATQAEVDAIIAQLNEVITNLNLALYKDVITSVGDGSKVTDGIISGQNFWDGDKYPSSFVIDLGKEYFLNEIKVHPLYRDTETRAYQYEVYVSCDNESFEMVAEKKNDELEVAAGTSYFFEDEIKARYIKVIMTKNNVNAYVHMSEVEAYGRLAVESDKSQLQQAIQDAQAIDTSIYTESSVEELSNALNNAIMVNDKVNASQKEVDEAYTTLLAAMNALQEKPMEVENVVASVINYKTIQLSWDAVQDAQSYIVERLTSEGEWLELVQTSETTYVATGVKTGKEYTYRVKAVNAEEVSEGVEVKATATLQGEVELTITPNGANQFDLSWTSVEGATRYIIYRKDGEGAWKKVLTLGKDVTSYTSKAMKANTYQYQVKAARYDSVDRVMTNGSNVVEGIVGLETMVPTNVKAEVEGTTVTLSWDKVVGMAYYEIYRSKDGGAYRQIKRTTDTTLTSSGLKAGSIYQYKIRAFALLNGEKVYAPEVVTEAIVIE